MSLYVYSLLSILGINVMLAVSLNLISGLCGQFSLGHGAFYGAGAYAAALCATALNELEWLTNGAQGLSITRPLLLGHALDARDFFWLCTAILALVWLAMRNLLSSQWGRAW